ncbi:unnamed protein product [Cyprideis torosa]|uniref:Uncharacterized protein n=1 Tax=Cyprideis torosa TaxID=163714 RepID=A0A7R8W7G9_9CRUS|nr:unnamed protein product [Cyprideis torosa]CAG0886323.1 unnamed protein product [Cyprideis torosa]
MELTDVCLDPISTEGKSQDDVCLDSVSTEGKSRDESVSQPLPTRPGLMYAIDDVPPLQISLLLGFQHFLMMVGGTILVPILLADRMCILDDDPSRLPIIQGTTLSLVLPAFAILDLPENKCPSESELEEMSADQRAEVWMSRMRIIQGGIIVASFFQVLVGYTGLVGYVMRWISPISICPLIALIGLSLFDVAVKDASSNWPIALVTIVLLLLFSQYIAEWNVPILPRWDLPSRTYLGATRLQIFKLFPIILAMCVSWFICFVLTLADALPQGSQARTDSRAGVLRDAPWIRVPYPFQWGMPQVTSSAVVGMLAGVFASAMESIGDYFACARLAGAPPPPIHAINRGIGTEGVGSVIAGIMGTGNGTTSYSDNIGAIGITGVGSRRVIQYSALLMLVSAVIGKFAALFSTIPAPVLGGTFCVMFGVIAAVGLSNLQYVDLDSSRNLLIVGFSLFIGLAVPWWVKENKGAIETGVKELDDVCRIFLSTSMVLGGAIAFILDNTIPGTSEERGMEKWMAKAKAADDNGARDECYDLPIGMEFIRRASWTKYLPFCPTYRGHVVSLPQACRASLVRRRESMLHF